MIEIEEDIFYKIVKEIEKTHKTGIIEIDDKKYIISSEGYINVTLVLEEDNTINWYFNPLRSDFPVTTVKVKPYE